MFKSEKGSITVFVLITVLFLTTVLLGILASSTNNQKAQMDAQKLIIDKYQEDVNNVENIYKEKALKF